MAINPNEINIKNIIELIQSSSIKDNDLLVIGQGIYARKSTVLELYNKFGVPSILTSLNSLQFQINQLNNTLGNSVLYSPQVKTPQQKADARNNLDVYSRSETQTVVNSAIVNLGNVVNSVTNVNPALVDNSDPKNPVIAEFREISGYNNDMLNKADIDGNLTIGGIWWQDQVLSDRFANYKQVWTALSNNSIEWGNIELDKHVFLVDDVNSLEIKTSTAVGTIWNTLNLTNVSQLNNDAGYLQPNDLDGFLYDVTYNSSTHTITFYQQNEPNIVIDLPIESLIKGVQLVGDDLVFTFEDGSTVTVPLNTLLVGVVKSVNGLNPNSQGEIILNVTDIPNLSSELSNKLDIRMAGLVSNLTQPEKDAIHTKLGIANNVTQVLSLSGNTLSLSGGGGSVNLGIVNISGLQAALNTKVDLDGSNSTGNLADAIAKRHDAVTLGTANGLSLSGQVLSMELAGALTTGTLTSTDWNNFNNKLDASALNGYATEVWAIGEFAKRDGTNLLNIVDWQDTLGITNVINSLNNKANVNGNNLTNIADWRSAIPWNLQQVVDNGNTSNKALIIQGTTYAQGIILSSSNFEFYTPSFGAQKVLTGGLLASDSYGDANLIPTNGIYSKGLISTELDGTSADWNAKVSQSQLANYALLSQVYTQSQALALFVGLNGVQTIADTKTFTSSPIVPNGTLNGHVVNKSQLDAVSASIPNAPNNGLLTISTSADLTGGGTFSADQASASNVNIGLSLSTLASLGLANSAVQPSTLANYLRLDGTSTMQSFIKFNNGWSSGGDVNVTSYYRFFNNGNSVVSFSPTGQIECSPAISNNEAVTLGQLNGLLPTTAQINNWNTAYSWGNHAGLYPLLSGSYANPNWISSLDWSKITNAPIIPTVGNGNITYIGTGAITGGGTSTANQSGNTNYTFDLTPQTKSDIQQGVEANTLIPSIIDGVDIFYVDNTSPINISIEKKKTIVNIADGLLGVDISVEDAPYDGYELAINGCNEWNGTVRGSIQNSCRIRDNISIGSSLSTSYLFWWSNDLGWLQAI